MADKNGFIESDHRFGGAIRLAPSATNHQKVRDPEQGFRKRAIEKIEEQRVFKAEDSEVWEND